MVFWATAKLVEMLVYLHSKSLRERESFVSCYQSIANWKGKKIILNFRKNRYHALETTGFLLHLFQVNLFLLNILILLKLRSNDCVTLKIYTLCRVTCCLVARVAEITHAVSFFFSTYSRAFAIFQLSWRINVSHFCPPRNYVLSSVRLDIPRIWIWRRACKIWFLHCELNAVRKKRGESSPPCGITRVNDIVGLDR